MKSDLTFPSLTEETVLLQLVTGYLALPALIYAVGFLRWVLVVPITILLVVAWCNQSHRPQMPSPDWRLVLAALMGAVWVLVVAGFPNGPFAWDWIKHWALINSLADHHWPVAIDLQGNAAYLRFYVGAYLVPALASKWGLVPVAVGTPIWFGLGCSLVMGLVMAVPARSSVALALVSMLAFLCMAGADAWGGMALRAFSGLPSVGVLGVHHEWWFDVWGSVPLQFGSMLASLVWVPHQSIATFLVAGLLVLDRTPRGTQRAVFSMGLLALWSPYGMLGLLPLAALRIAEIWRVRRDWQMWAAVLFAVGFTVVVAASLLDDAPQGSICFSCLPSWLSRLQEFSLFWLVELCVFALILGRKMFVNGICLVNVATLIFLPLLAGPVPDFVMRAAMGPLFVLSLCSAHAVAAWLTGISTTAWSWGRSARMMFALMLASATVLGEISYHFSAGKKHLALPASDPLANRGYYTFAQTSSITVDDFFAICGWSWRQQYFIDHLPRTYRQTTE